MLTRRKICNLFVFKVLIFCAFTTKVFSQEYLGTWHFGYSCHMEFTSAGLVADTISSQFSYEGVASPSNYKDSLLFYTNSEKVWTKNHIVMPNGDNLRGSNSSTESPAVFHLPSETNRFYLFNTLANEDNSDSSLSYSIVDMTLNGGLGDIDINHKNVILKPQSSEHVTAYPGRGSNEGNYWVVSSVDSNVLIVYKVIPNNTVIFDHIQTIGNSTLGTGYGYLKFSQNGAFFAYPALNTQSAISGIQILRFNPENGYFTDPIFLKLPSSVYGIEFSPNARYLYSKLINPELLFRVDLINYDSASVNSSIDTLALNTGFYRSLQLGYDGNIYTTKSINPGILGRITSPNDVNPTYQDSVIALDCTPNLGFPIDLDYPFLDFHISGNCVSDSLLFTVNSVDSVIWDFGDPITGNENKSKQFNAKHLFSDSGVFNVMAVIFTNGSVDTVIKSVRVLTLPNANLEDTVFFCKEDTLNVRALYGDKYQWSDSSTSQSIKVFLEGVYTVTVSNYCGVIVDTLYAKEVEPLKPHLGSDTIICKEDTLEIYLNEVIDETNGSNWTWWDDDTISFSKHLGSWLANSTDQINIWLEVQNACGMTRDSMSVQLIPLPDASLPRDTTMCGDKQFVLERPHENFVSYYWSDGTSDSIKTVGVESQMVLSAKNLCGFDSDTFNIDFRSGIQLDLGPDTVICRSDSIILNAYLPEAEYSWNDAIPFNKRKDSIVVISKANTYVLTISDGTCIKTDSITISQSEIICDSIECKFDIPNIFTPNSDGVNDELIIKNSCSKLAFDCLIYNRWGQLIMSKSSFSNGSCSFVTFDGYLNGQRVSEGTYYVLIRISDSIDSKNVFTSSFSMFY